MRLDTVLFGAAEFEVGEEYVRFQYRFLIALIFFGLLFTGLFLMSSHLALCCSNALYRHAATVFGIGSVALLLALRGHRDRMVPIACLHAMLTFLLYVVAFLINSGDEMRLVWFCLNLPGIYLVLGPFAGIVATVVSVLFVLTANPFLDRPYSSDAIITTILAISYISAFFHAFTNRSISFHHAMVEANLRLNEMATRDPLTGLLNARAFYPLCNRLISAAQRSRQPFSVLFIDLDHFKRVNDLHGHQAGDTVLKTVAACLAREVRGSDVIGRIGGEEFSILLPGTDLTGALFLAEKLRQNIENLSIGIAGTSLRMTASIGAAQGRPDHHDIATVQREADEAMYLAKRDGRNRISVLTRRETHADALAG